MPHARAAAKPVDLLAGLSGWPKVLASVGAFGFLLLIFGYLLVYEGPHREAECFRQFEAQRDRDEARTQRLLDAIQANHRELSVALDANRRATDALADELRRARLAGAKVQLEVVPEE